jgi:hypothetical protein
MTSSRSVAGATRPAPQATQSIAPKSSAAPEPSPEVHSQTSSPTAGRTPDAFSTASGTSIAKSERLSSVGLEPSPPQLAEPLAVSNPTTASLAEVLGALAPGRSRQSVIDAVAADLQAHTGVRVPDEVREAVAGSPERIFDLFALTPGQMRTGFDMLQGAARALPKAHPSGETASSVLPSHANLDALETLAIVRPSADLRQIAPGLYRGTVPSDLPDAQARLNIIMAEVMDKLASNASRPADQQFTVGFNGRTFDRLDQFLRALVSAGYTVEAAVEHQAADVFQLKARAPDGALRDVAAPVMVRTGAKTSTGEEAVLPASHSELVFRIRSSAATRAPRLDSVVKWYQGTHSTGFIPFNVNREPEWRGRTRSALWTGDDALRAAQLAGLMSDVINDAARGKGMMLAGYGVTGVCNDSVAIVQKALGGTVVSYPLLMKDSVMTDTLASRMQNENASDHQAYRLLSQAIEAVPSDDERNSTSWQRAANSIPWPQGAEAFHSTKRARQILDAAVAGGDESSWL